MIFFLFTALTAQFADLDGFLNPEYSSHRYNAQIVAGVMFHTLAHMFSEIWKFRDSVTNVA